MQVSNYYNINAVFISLLIFLPGLSASADKPSEIHSLVESTKLTRYSDITFFVRMPQQPPEPESERHVRSVGRSGNAVRGVLALCTHRTEAEDVRINVTDNGRFKWFVQFADQHNLALVTWTNFKGYKKGVSGDEMDADAYKQYDKDFDARAREWRTGWRRLCRQYNLPEQNVMLYGISGGAQMGHRLALRMPEYFFGVHIHVNSSYDQIKRDGNQILWLVTTGTQEYGYPAGVRFYREALEAGYHMIFRAEENLGHRDSAETRATGRAFWEYCLKFLPDATDPGWRPPPVDRFYLMRHPTYIGDYLNSEAFPRETAPQYMEPEVMVALPNKDIAEAWGTVLNIEL
jgi:hypothetical protein